MDQRNLGIIRQISEWNRKKRPERLFFEGCGAGAQGVFEPYMNLQEETKADFLQGPEKEVPVTVRFSRMNAGRGGADTVRDLRGFSVRFHTKDGAFDLLSLHLPEFYIRKAEEFSDLVNALSPDPASGLTNRELYWIFLADHPESLPCFLLLFSDRGTIKSYRHMEGYSPYAYRLKAEGTEKASEPVFFFWKPDLGARTITGREAEFLSGFDPEAARRDLNEAVAGGEEPSWQLWMRKKDGEAVCTGRMRLTKVPDNYEAEIERLNFSPLHLVPGIELSGDEMQMMMAFACEDGQRYRLGEPDGSSALLSLLAAEKARQDFEPEYFLKRAQMYYGEMNGDERDALAGNLAEEFLFLDEPLQVRLLALLKRVDKGLGEALEQWLKL